MEGVTNSHYKVEIPDFNLEANGFDNSWYCTMKNKLAEQF